MDKEPHEYHRIALKTSPVQLSEWLQAHLLTQYHNRSTVMHSGAGFLEYGLPEGRIYIDIHPKSGSDFEYVFVSDEYHDAIRQHLEQLVPEITKHFSVADMP